MDTAGHTWKQHALAIGFRLLCMAVISMAGVVTGTDDSPQRPDGSEQAPGVAGLLFVLGVVAALVFAAVASCFHARFRQRPLRVILLTDTLLAAAFIAFMVWQGAKAKHRPASSGNPSARLVLRPAAQD